MPNIVDLSSHLIGNPGGGVTLYTIPNASMQVFQDVINASWNEGLNRKNEFTAKIAAATTGFLDTANTPTVAAGAITGSAIVEPGVTIPASADVGDVMSMFDTKYLELVALLSTKFTDFRTAYFPDEHNAYLAAENALQDAMTNDSYLPAATQAQIFGDDEARIVDAKLRAQDAVVAQFATRGFPLPPDVAASAVLQIEQKAQDELAESSRKVAVLSVEQFRFTVGKILELRQSAMGAAIEYVKALASGPDMASRLVNVGYDAQSKLISAASSFYNARIDAAKTMNAVAQYNNSTELEADMKNQAAELTMIGEKMRAMLAEAQAIAQMATALFNNLNVSTSMAANGGTQLSQTGEF